MSVMFDTDGMVVARLTRKQAAGLWALIASVEPVRWGLALNELQESLLAVLDTVEDDVLGYVELRTETQGDGALTWSIRPTKRKLPKLDAGKTADGYS